MILGDRVQRQQVIIHLGGDVNAHEAMPRSRGRAIGETIRLSDENHRVDAEDRCGVGISAENANRLSNPSSQQVQGLGMRPLDLSFDSVGAQRRTSLSSWQ